jgi:branched-chain amino acid transport system substrate-binding protein
MTRLRIGALVAVIAAIAAVFAANAMGSKQQGPILIGISAAKTGILAPYDLQAAQLFQMRIEEINKQGGVLGRKLTTQWIDTKTDKALAATNANELISKGAVAIIATCDFDYSFPAINAAAGKGVPGLALCASSPKVATPAIVTKYGGSMGLGSDTEGSAGAEWWMKKKKNLKNVYVFKDTSLEYSKATADYFAARFKELGGNVVATDTFVGGPNLDLSSQITRLRGKIDQVDFIYDGSWNPYGALLIRAIRDAGINKPILTNASVNGTPVTENAGKVSNFYALGFVCLNTYCTGNKNKAVDQVNARFKKKYGQPIGNHYATRGYDLADAVVAAIKKAGSAEPAAIQKALFESNLVLNTLNGKQQFTSKCHRPQPATYTVEQFTNGQGKLIDSVSVQKVPNIGDGSPCSGVPPKVK